MARAILRALVWIGTVLGLAHLSGLTRWGAWYSGHFAFRLQTAAFLRGSLALQPVPQGQSNDWAWGVGSQQVWGLGMPLVRLPFEALARLGGGFGFPDAIGFVLLFAGVVLVVAHAFRPRDERAWWEWTATLAAVAFCPAFVNLCRTRFEAYEEAVAGGFLVAALLGALLAGLAAKPRSRALCLLCGLAGFGPLVRPTLVFYGVPAVILALLVCRRLPWRTHGLAGLLFLAGIGLLLGTNQARFQHPLEFGHHLNVSYTPLDQYGKDFESAYAREPLRSAAAELYSALFQSRRANGFAFYDGGVLPLQSKTLRFREFYFATFGSRTAAALLLAWVGVLATRLTRPRVLDEDPRIAVTAAFSFLGFAGQAAFYLRTHAITSRYVVDFAAAIALGMVALLLLAFALLRRQPVASIVLSTVTWALIGSALFGAWFGEAQAQRVLLTAEEARQAMPLPRMAGARPPDRYVCGQPPELATGIGLNGEGWNSAGNCAVKAVTDLFFPSLDCLTLRVRPLVDGESLGPERTRSIRVKRGLWPMANVRDVAEGADRLLTFCGADTAPRNPTGVEIVFIAWAPVEDLPGRPHRLRLVEASVAKRQ